MVNRNVVRSSKLTTVCSLVAMLTASACTPAKAPVDIATALPADIAEICTAERLPALISGIGYGVTIAEIPNGPKLSGGVQLVPAKNAIPAYCQVTGSYVTNPATGKTANFLATLPERWNGKFLQLGCSGGCGFLLMNNPASPPIAITAQGYPGQLIEKGYATFGNDLGRVASGPSSPLEWTLNADGTPNPDSIEDYSYRADLVMADMGKAFAKAFYSGLTKSNAQISRSYFSGCSQGGREALIAATRFPEKYDGIIAGSPVSDQPGSILAGLGMGIRSQKGDIVKFTAGQIKLINDQVNSKCDALDGVKDGLIQNPAACNIHPTRDFPVCKSGNPTDSCISEAQAEAVSNWLSGATDEAGNLLQPGFSISEQGYGGIGPIPAESPIDSHVRSTIGKAFEGKRLAYSRSGGPGDIDAYRVIIDRNVYDSYLSTLRKATVMPEDFSTFMRSRTKLLWYHNLSDEALTPYMSINRYKRLAELHGGYAKLQKSIRFFTIPNSGHCGMSGTGPSNFDAIGALEAWVEKGKAPNAILARQPDPQKENMIFGTVNWSTPSPRTMPLCPFPQMASYKGSGNVSESANWECRSGDKRMLTVGETGMQAGVRH